MTSRPILVTGASGTVGSCVVRMLAEAGVPVRAAARTTAALACAGDPASLGERGISPVAFDFTDATSWPAAYDGVERMFLLRPPHLGRPRQQMIPSLEAARAAGVRHVVFLSLQGVGGNRVVPHAALEGWLRESGLGWTFLRASFFMQNLTTTHVGDIRDRDEIVVPAGTGATALVDAVDVASVATAALLDPTQHDRRVWTPTGPEALTYREVAAILSDTLGRPIHYRRPGALRYVHHARSTLRLPWGMVAVTTAIYTLARLGRAAGLTDDVTVVTGHSPRSFADFAAAHAQRWERGS